MAKSTRKKATSQAAEKSPSGGSGASGGDKLVGAVWHNGKIYDPKNPADQAAFRKLAAEEKKLGATNKDGSPRAQLDLQRLADEGHVVGFGMKASKKGKRNADQMDADADLDTDDGDAPVGGGVDATEEQDLMEEEVETQEEDR